MLTRHCRRASHTVNVIQVSHGWRRQVRRKCPYAQGRNFGFRTTWSEKIHCPVQERSGFPNRIEWKPRGQPSAIVPPSRRSNDTMGIRDFLRIPRKHRRARSEARNEANPVGGRPVDLAGLPHSQPDLGIGSSILPTSVPPTPQNREPSGM